jgi:catechol-2,3-dioxygenase
MKTPTVRGVRSIEIEMSDPERAADFYTRVWNLKEIERKGGSIYFRGTGAYHHILAIHQAKGPFGRIVLDAAIEEFPLEYTGEI